jgi:membrane protein implicated in regulation of membrane protease activity
VIVVLAHAGHWLVQVAYFLPVVLFLVWLGWVVLRDKRREKAERAEPQG